ncbi:hypothetical protein JXB41_01095 [Candidatus Woesearchaeota archaeon]|nr:hypothetical protein [Candidatus Woesearchaeota archaeon]
MDTGLFIPATCIYTASGMYKTLLVLTQINYIIVLAQFGIANPAIQQNHPEI